MTWNYRVVSKVTYNSYMKWYSVDVIVESDNGQQNFSFIYHDKPEEKTVKVCMNRALRAFCLHQLDELNNPFDKNNDKAFGYSNVEVTQKTEETAAQKYSRLENTMFTFLDPDKKANDFDDEDEE